MCQAIMQQKRAVEPVVCSTSWLTRHLQVYMTLEEAVEEEVGVGVAVEEEGLTANMHAPL